MRWVGSSKVLAAQEGNEIVAFYLQRGRPRRDGAQALWAFSTAFLLQVSEEPTEEVIIAEEVTF